MKNKGLLLSFLIIVTSWSWPLAAQQQPHEIVWAANISPPFHIVSGPYANQGLCDALVDAFKEALPNTKHKVEYLPQLRIGMLWEQEKNICFPCMIHRSNEVELIAFSNPTHTYPTHGIITRPSLVAELTEKYGNPLDLELLLRDQLYRFGQPVGRLYGKLQPLLDDYVIGTPQHIDVSGDTANTSMMSMILSKRLDFTIDYPMVKRFYEETEGRSLAFIPVTQLVGDIILGAVACTKNAWGDDTVRQINEVIPEVQNNPHFMQAQEFWLENSSE